MRIPFSKQKKLEELVQPSPIKALLEFTEEDEEYVNMMLRKEALRTLQRIRDGPRPKQAPSLIDPEIDKVLTQIEAKLGLIKDPIKNCRKCYFSTSFWTIGINWYCFCTNIARTPYSTKGMWIRCKSNLKCWREP